MHTLPRHTVASSSMNGWSVFVLALLFGQQVLCANVRRPRAHAENVRADFRSGPRLGWNADFPLNYSLLGVNKSASVRNLQDVHANEALERSSSRSFAACQSSGLGELETGGWCLSSEGTSVHPCRNQSYKLPPGHVPADDKFVHAVHELLRSSSTGKYMSVADFGAGIGQLGHHLRCMDPKHRYRGYDGAGNVEQITAGFVKFFDLTINLSLPRADFVVSTEVGEHVPNGHEQTLIRNLHAHNCKGVILSWARLGQYGRGHINNHSRRYISHIFDRLGYYVDRFYTNIIRNGVPGRNYPNTYDWFRRARVFRRYSAVNDPNC